MVLTLRDWNYCSIYVGICIARFERFRPKNKGQ